MSYREEIFGTFSQFERDLLEHQPDVEMLEAESVIPSRVVLKPRPLRARLRPKPSQQPEYPAGTDAGPARVCLPRKEQRKGLYSADAFEGEPQRKQAKLPKRRSFSPFCPARPETLMIFNQSCVETNALIPLFERFGSVSVSWLDDASSLLTFESNASAEQALSLLSAEIPDDYPWCRLQPSVLTEATGLDIRLASDVSVLVRPCTAKDLESVPLETSSSSFSPSTGVGGTAGVQSSVVDPAVPPAASRVGESGNPGPSSSSSRGGKFPFDARQPAAAAASPSSSQPSSGSGAKKREWTAREEVGGVGDEASASASAAGPRTPSSAASQQKQQQQRERDPQPVQKRLGCSGSGPSSSSVCQRQQQQPKSQHAPSSSQQSFGLSAFGHSVAGAFGHRWSSPRAEDREKGRGGRSYGDLDGDPPAEVVHWSSVGFGERLHATGARAVDASFGLGRDRGERTVARGPWLSLHGEKGLGTRGPRERDRGGRRRWERTLRERTREQEEIGGEGSPEQRGHIRTGLLRSLRDEPQDGDNERDDFSDPRGKDSSDDDNASVEILRGDLPNRAGTGRGCHKNRHGGMTRRSVTAALSVSVAAAVAGGTVSAGRSEPEPEHAVADALDEAEGGLSQLRLVARGLTGQALAELSKSSLQPEPDEGLMEVEEGTEREREREGGSSVRVGRQYGLGRCEGERSSPSPSVSRAMSGSFRRAESAGDDSGADADVESVAPPVSRPANASSAFHVSKLSRSAHVPASSSSNSSGGAEGDGEPSMMLDVPVDTSPSAMGDGAFGGAFPARSISKRGRRSHSLFAHPCRGEKPSDEHREGSI
uniref:Uncharacterized protein n=1 Tax=Chromera velia CCMP2878 TaxID=1169474 RepID=A0A0G4GUL9_9ALVE|eukprot:Cvel_23452.t1-p1 / transcript=Cvel_23452.t1 / gene=Cvel_23452 / organism=Chromera_velia_CCMP2878 / gene_product=hypothetical protein / transcript_product=hypothetical protein / location=Cvel_scaffold2418:7251-10785(-) / protein_length=824 / sequence_SO=supercontig / SO=protein_coding / is_pseudo=false